MSASPLDLAVVDGAVRLLGDGTAWAVERGEVCQVAQPSWSVRCALWRSAVNVFGDGEESRRVYDVFRRLQGEGQSSAGAGQPRDFHDVRGTLAETRVELAHLLSREQGDVVMVPWVLVELHASQHRPPSVADSVASRGHFEHLGRLEREGLLLVAGPVESGPGGSLAGILILRLSDPALADSVTAGDPAVQAGLLESRSRVVWLPAGLRWPDPRYGLKSSNLF